VTLQLAGCLELMDFGDMSILIDLVVNHMAYDKFDEMDQLSKSDSKGSGSCLLHMDMNDEHDYASGSSKEDLVNLLSAANLLITKKK
jgi:hypothetical protein